MTFTRGLLWVRFGYAAAFGVNGEYRELGALSKRYPMMNPSERGSTSRSLLSSILSKQSGARPTVRNFSTAPPHPKTTPARA
jgi:hypothetical protein